MHQPQLLEEVEPPDSLQMPDEALADEPVQQRVRKELRALGYSDVLVPVQLTGSAG
jgi:hypothetical protein